VCFHGQAIWGRPRPDLHEASDAAWFAPADVAALPVQPAARLFIVHALSGADEPHLG
jgi:8-oxo-dGTP diphosphatase